MGKIYTVINNGAQQKQVKNDLLDEYLSDGWKIGKLMPAWNKGLTAENDDRVANNLRGLKDYYANWTQEQDLERREKLRELNLGKKWTSEAIAKRTESRRGFVPSLEQREKVSRKLKGHPVSDETRIKISIANTGHPGTPCSEEKKTYLSQLHSSAEYQERQNAIKKKNGTFNTSRPEQTAFQSLRSVFGEDDVEYSYRDDRYPYNCDFYVRSMDLFIELNILWTHGGEPFDPENDLHLHKLETWRNKSETSDYYKNAIYTWTKLDVRKQQTAIENHLNYLTFYKEKEFTSWLKNFIEEKNDILNSLEVNENADN